VALAAVISVQNVSKRYLLYRHPLQRMLGMAGLSKALASEFWALKNVSFGVDPGEVVGIIGPNGSGKSTLLQVIAGILQPTTGRVLCSGRVAALLELGAGFNPEFTGRENVYLNGEIMGLSRSEMDHAFRKIEAFAEIGTFIDRPVKEYSTGMYVRLAFSTAIHVEPEVLIVDEALSVGDAIFASRCIQKFEELRQRKVTVLFVSHDLGLVKRLCDRALFVLRGEVVLEGSAKDAVNRYVGFVLDREQTQVAPSLSTPAISSTFRHGDGLSRITDVRILNAAGRDSSSFLTGDQMTIRVQAKFERPAESPVVGILVRNRVGIDIFGTNTRIEGIQLGSFVPGEVLEVEFHLDCILSRQEYTLTVATQHANGLSQDWLDDAVSFTVVDAKDVAGVLNMRTRIEFRKLGHSSHVS
jgi:lipopolysaccharide transport system ATP-binding protein